MNSSRYFLTFGILLSLFLIIGCAGCMPMSDIQKASSKGSIAKVNALLEKGVDINDFSPLHGTPLSIAAGQGDTVMVQHLLDKGANINSCSPLSAAVWDGHAEIAQLLIERGADVNSGWQSDSPLQRAAEQNRVDMVTLLLAANADPDGNGRGDPLWIAAYRGYDDVVLQLLVAGANPNLRDCLDVAVRHSPSLVTTHLLLENGADVNVRDEQDMSALHFAALYGRTEHVRLLVKHGANVAFVAESGKTAEDYARENGYPVIVEMLSVTK
ncbi:MAG: ankyrin repeat domain-containing protein [Desulfuromusa sp.]|nr:ankyrin repeat domain-containing protein [Desulfuromusa sp.]